MKIALNEEVKALFSYFCELLGFNTYIVGGYIRDLLLGEQSFDIDFTTAKKPDELHSLFKDALYFNRVGTISFKLEPFEITIATLREEGEYLDFRHPSSVSFVDDYKRDYLRRDFTVNAIYCRNDGVLLDPSGLGLKDLEDKKLRMIGDPDKRLKEDPLRIIRAYRLALKHHFSFDFDLKTALERDKNYLLKLKSNKIREELEKCDPHLRNIIKGELRLEELEVEGGPDEK